MEFVRTDKAPKAVGPYSQAVVSGNFVFVSGQIPLDPETGKMVEGDIEEKTRRVLENVSAVLESAGLSLKNVVKVTVFITDLSNFEKVNKVYSEFFGDHKPARSFVEVSSLPKGAEIEIEVIAEKG